MTLYKNSTAKKNGSLLTRVLVPLWILTGAIFKLVAQTPSTLPKFTIFDPARSLDIDLGILLNVLIGLEFLAIGVIVFMPRLSRLMAGFMLGSFVLILTNELFKGADSCGCLGGKIKIHPGVMMGIDGALLVGVIVLPIFKVHGVRLMTGIVPAVAVTVLGFSVSFGAMSMSQNRGEAPPPPIVNNDDKGDLQIDLTQDPCEAAPVQIAFPNFWYVSGDINDWVGQCWNQIDLFKLIRQWPKDIAEGEKLVVLYRRDCDHCEEMFNNDFTGKITTPILAYHIPVESANWTLPANHTAKLYDMPNKTEWIITTPLVVKLVDGRIECAAEGEGFEACLGVEPADH